MALAGAAALYRETPDPSRVVIRSPVLLGRAQPHRITPANRATPRDSRIHANMGLIVLHRRAQDTGVLREISLGQGRHDTATAGARDAQANLVPDGQRATDPGILDKARLSAQRFHHDVRAKSRDL